MKSQINEIIEYLYRYIDRIKTGLGIAIISNESYFPFIITIKLLKSEMRVLNILQAII